MARSSDERPTEMTCDATLYGENGAAFLGPSQACPWQAECSHIEADGRKVYAHACKMGLEGIVSKRLGTRYRSGRSPDWQATLTATGTARVIC